MIGDWIERRPLWQVGLFIFLLALAGKLITETMPWE